MALILPRVFLVKKEAIHRNQEQIIIKEPQNSKRVDTSTILVEDIEGTNFRIIKIEGVITLMEDNRTREKTNVIRILIKEVIKVETREKNIKEETEITTSIMAITIFEIKEKTFTIRIVIKMKLKTTMIVGEKMKIMIKISRKK